MEARQFVTYRICAGLSFFLWTLAAHGVPLAPEGLEERALEAAGVVSGEAEPRLTVSESRILIANTFYTPFCVENWPELGRARGSVEEKVSFGIRKNETLRSCLDRYVELSNGLYEWKVIHNIICLLPKKSSPEQIVNNLDLKVSLHVKEVSTWEALCALAREMNLTARAKEVTGYAVCIVPKGPGELKKAPPELTEVRTVSVDLTDVTAREALCAILQASPLRLKYHYINSRDYDWISIWAHKEPGAPRDRDGLVYYGGMMDKQDMETWTAERIQQIQGFSGTE